MTLTYKAPCVEMDTMENLWFQLSNIACNIKCKHCFLNCHHEIKKKNFLEPEKIKSELEQDFKNLKRIFLTGGEPVIHPKFFDILALCLKKSDVTVCSNGTLLNEKRIQKFKHLENVLSHQVSFNLSLDHFTEGRNDEYRARGVFKKVIKSLQNLQKHGFKTKITCVNLKNDNTDTLIHGFMELFEKNNIELCEDDIKIVPLLKIGNYAKFYNISEKKEFVTYDDFKNFDCELLDCKSSRVVTVDGVYCCPALVSDPRGKTGETLMTSSNKVYLETQTCLDCVKNSTKLFG